MNAALTRAISLLFAQMGLEIIHVVLVRLDSMVLAITLMMENVLVRILQCKF